jgi:hypothetical protein
MQAISIATIATTNGERVYQATIGNQQSTGKTAGEALDALTVQMGNQEINGFFLLQSWQPDKFFTSEQQQRLTELMLIWRRARDRGQTMSPEQQSELDNLIEIELYATTERAKAMISQMNP